MLIARLSVKKSGNMMQFDRSVASLGLAVTYFLQVAFAYLTTLSICAFIPRNARLRLRIWGGFLIWAVAAWVLLWIPAPETKLVLAAVHSVPLPSTARLHLAMPMPEPWASYFARLSPAVVFLYFFCFLISVLYLFFESRRLKSTLRLTLPPSPQLQSCFESLCDELHVRRCELRLAAELRSPATCYWWRSHVLLPLELVPHLDSEQLEDILRHELFHVRQHDYLWDRLAALGCRVVFFHPLAWLALSASAMGARVGLRLCGRKRIQRSTPAICRVSYEPSPLVHGKKRVFAGNNFLFFRIPAQSESSGRSQRTLELLSFSKSCSCGTCLRSCNCCFFIAARSRTISVYTDSPDERHCSIWPCRFGPHRGKRGRGARLLILL